MQNIRALGPCDLYLLSDLSAVIQPDYLQKVRYRIKGELCYLQACMLVRTLRTVKSRKLRWGGYVSRRGETRIAYRILESEALGTPNNVWESDINVLKI